MWSMRSSLRQIRGCLVSSEIIRCHGHSPTGGGGMEAHRRCAGRRTAPALRPAKTQARRTQAMDLPVGDGPAQKPLTINMIRFIQRGGAWVLGQGVLLGAFVLLSIILRQGGLQECGTSWLVALGLEETSLQAIPVCGDAEVGVDHAQQFVHRIGHENPRILLDQGFEHPGRRRTARGRAGHPRPEAWFSRQVAGEVLDTEF